MFIGRSNHFIRMVPTAYMLQWKQFTNGVVAANPNMQVFEILVNAMTTYKPLLKRIKRQYDRALEDAMKSSFENINLKSEFAAAESNLSKAVDDALAECADNALILRDQLFSQLAGLESKAALAEAEAQASETCTKDTKQELLQLQNKTIALQQENRKLQEQLMAKSTWSVPAR